MNNIAVSYDPSDLLSIIEKVRYLDVSDFYEFYHMDDVHPDAKFLDDYNTHPGTMAECALLMQTRFSFHISVNHQEHQRNLYVASTLAGSSDFEYIGAASSYEGLFAPSAWQTLVWETEDAVDPIEEYRRRIDAFLAEILRDLNVEASDNVSIQASVNYVPENGPVELVGFQTDDLNGVRVARPETVERYKTPKDFWEAEDSAFFNNMTGQCKPF